MIYWLSLTLAAIFSSAACQSSDYLITPVFPPTAFVGLFYTVSFRIIGAGDSQPKLSFTNLPSFLVESGKTLSGIPTDIGVYEIGASFIDGQTNEVEQIITIRVLEADLQQAKNDYKSLEIDKPLLFRAGGPVTLRLSDMIEGGSQVSWTYVNLPLGLRGTTSGLITGTILQAGYYTFGATAAGDRGYLLDYYFTIKVYNALQRESIDNTVRNTLTYSIHDIEVLQNQSSSQLQQARDNVRKSSQSLESIKAALLERQSNLRIAEEQYRTFQLITINLTKELQQVTAHTRGKSQVLSTVEAQYNDTFDLYEHSFNAKREAVRVLNQLIPLRNQLATMKNQAIIDFNLAQSSLGLSMNSLQLAYMAASTAQDDSTVAFVDLAEAKKQYQRMEYELVTADWQVDTVNMSRQNNNIQRESAIRVEKTAMRQVQLAVDISLSRNNEANTLRRELEKAEMSVGQGQFQLLQAQNRLLVAQAQKKQADKLLLTASSQLVQEAAFISTSFNGCDPKAYPSISGTAQIEEVHGTGYLLNSGHKLLYGSCTEGDIVSVKQGDVIEYEGYLKDGYVQLQIVSQS